MTEGVAAVAGAAVHTLAATPVWCAVGRSVPGVIVGGTVGTRLGTHLPAAAMERVLDAVFAPVGLVVLATEFVIA
jgi:hypothetical protein